MGFACERCRSFRNYDMNCLTQQSLRTCPLSLDSSTRSFESDDNFSNICKVTLFIVEMKYLTKQLEEGRAKFGSQSIMVAGQ